MQIELPSDFKQSHDKRTYRRVVFKEPVHFEMNKPVQSGGCLSCDLSEGGVRLRLSDFVPVDTELNLQIQVKKDNYVDCAGRVAWITRIPFSEHFQAGIEFTGQQKSLVTRKRIAEFLL